MNENARKELWHLLDYEPSAALVLETAILTDTLDGADYRTCMYGTVAFGGQGKTLYERDAENYPEVIRLAKKLRSQVIGKIEIGFSPLEEFCFNIIRDVDREEAKAELLAEIHAWMFENERVLA